MNSISATMSI